MKKLVYLITLTAMSFGGVSALRGQAAAGSSTTPAAEAQQEQAQAIVQRLAAARNQMDPTHANGTQGGAAHGAKALWTRRSACEALVVRTSEADAKDQANLEEDLAVMSHIFDKAIGESPGHGEHAPRAMGIEVFYASGRAPVHNMYLDGYGALFFLNVNFPLLAPPAKNDEPKEKPTGDSAWQQARQELYGQPAHGTPDAFSTEENTREEYSAEKVNNLKHALLEALKDATNIRNLKSEDSITVCVFGESTIAGRNRLTGQTVFGVSDQVTGYSIIPNLPDMAYGASRSMKRATVITIRARKTDVDAFAKGELNLDEFRKKAILTTYEEFVKESGGGSNGFGGGSGGSGGGGFGGGNFFGGGGSSGGNGF